MECSGSSEHHVATGAQARHSGAKMEAMVVCNSMEKRGMCCWRHGPWIFKSEKNSNSFPEDHHGFHFCKSAVGGGGGSVAIHVNFHGSNF